MKRWLPLILLVVVVLAVWIIGELARQALSTRMIGSAIALALFALWYLAAWLIDRRAAAPRPATSASDGAAKPAVRVLENQWREALASLRQAHPRSAEQPWYLVVGAPNSGKTSLLLDAGIGLAPVAGAGPGEARPTSTFAWWRNDESLFIDTAGRYTADPRSRPEWLALLRQLRAARPDAPLQGVIACVPVGDLIKKGESAMAGEAQGLRERLDELTAELGVAVPLYVVFTKCDALGGFKDFFADAGRGEKEQVLGYTHPWQAPSTDLGAACAEQNRKLFTALQTRRLLALGKAVNDESRRKLFQFPIQFLAAQRFVGEFLGALARANPLRESAIFRGFYYTSCFQQPARPVEATAAPTTSAPAAPAAPRPAPIALDASIFLSTSQVGLAAPATKAAADARLGFFSNRLLAQVVVPDRALARPTRRSQARARRVRTFCVVVAPSLAALACLWLAYGAARSISLIASCRLPAQSVIDAERNAPNDPARNLEALDALGGRVAELIDTDRGRLDPVVKGAGSLYARRLGSLLLDPCMARVRTDLETLRTTASSSAASAVKDQLYDLYRTYQMLGGRIAASPEVIERTLNEKRRWLVGLEAAGIALDRHTETLAKKQLTLVATHLVPAKLVRIDLDQRVLDAVNKELGESLWIRQGYDDVMRSLAGQFSTLAPESLTSGPEANALTAEGGFSQAFSRQGWNDAVRKALEEKSEGIARTCAELQIPHDVEAIQRRLVERFAGDHQRHWLGLLASTRANGVRELRDAPDTILRLTGKDSPYPGLVKTALGELGLETSGYRLLGPSEKTDWTNPALQAMSELRKDLQQFLAATEAGRRSADTKRVKDLADRFNAISARIGETLGAVQPSEKRAALQKGLDRILRSLWEPLDREMAHEQDRVWREQVHRAFSSGLAGKFPFADAPAEVPLVDFARMFNPVSGWLWSAVRPIEELRAIQVVGEPALTLSEAYQGTLARAQDIRAIFFAANSETVNAPFTLTLVQREGVEDLSFIVGAQTFHLYDRPDARFQAFLKQGEPPAAKIAIRVVTSQWKTQEPGKMDWALLRLLRMGDPKVQAKGAYLFTWPFEGKAAGANVVFKACVLLEANGMEKAVIGDLLTGFVVPETIAPGSSTEK